MTKTVAIFYRILYNVICGTIYIGVLNLLRKLCEYMRSIKTKISLLVILCTAIAAVAVSIISFMYSNTVIEKDSREIISNACMKTASQINAYILRTEQSVNILAEYALEQLDDFESFKTSDEYVDAYTEKLAPVILSAAEHTDGAVTAYIRYNPDLAYPTSGNFIMRNSADEPYYTVPNTDFSIYEKTDLNRVGWYYIPVNNGKPTWMSPYYNENIDVYMISYVVPLFWDGTSVGIIGMDIDFTLLEHLAETDTVYATASSFIIDGDRNIMYHENIEFGTKLDEIDPNGGADAMCAALDSESADDELITMTFGKHEYLATYKPLRNGMTVITAVLSSDVNKSRNSLFYSIAGTSAVIIAIAALIAMAIVSTISKPIASLNDTVRQVASGNLDVEINVKSNDEIGSLAQNFSGTVSQLNEYVDYITEVSDILRDIADGNLDFSLTKNYVGEFERIKASLIHISNTLNRTIYDISSAAEQVAEGSEQVSAGAQALAQSSTQQTNSIQALSTSIEELTADVDENNKSIHGAFEAMETAVMGINESSSDMRDMHNAMNDISDASEQISNIVRTVDDIASQTNILAINAAIEAARAGEAGKGFAVVAGEIQLLASKVAAATSNINELVENVMHTVKRGRQISEKADGSIQNVANTSETVKSALREISVSSEKQSQSIENINMNIKQITDVVENNSATAEESASASEEMRGQAQVLRQRIGMFKLKKR